ncbi:TPA: CpsD/CapB family tyrosine-protein kinase [Clostridium perfringens]|nr:CpsD/CapB family tyrosine-protein kinase [Clostridium perfringens]HAT4253661.1 CpsD/CapB family tyrosine-protein kinase [Clostridium perfringens]HAT4269390.1 CpsD/CapB family tyrosine-protein kinase [Clostridium perfringens]
MLENNSKTIVAESYRTLRTNIQYSSFDKPIKSIVITSSEPGEGKSTTSSNLALSFAQEGKKVILIDCDLRKPVLHKEFQISNSRGLSEFLIGNVEFSKVVYKHESGLHVLPSGLVPPNPAEMLASMAMEHLLTQLEEKYDYIILDTPPVNAVTDSKILSTKVDGTILVVKYGYTKKDAVMEAVKGLRAVNSNIIGTVFNGEENKRGKYYHYYKKD